MTVDHALRRSAHRHSRLTLGDHIAYWRASQWSLTRTWASWTVVPRLLLAVLILAVGTAACALAF